MPVELPTIRETALYTFSEVAALLPKPVTLKTVRQWVKEGKLSVHTTLNRVPYVRGDCLIRFLNGQS